MRSRSKSKKTSDLGQYVRDWKEGMKVDRKDLIEFALNKGIDLDSITTRRDIQSLVTKFIIATYSSKKSEKEQKDKKDVQEIDPNPPKDQEEQDQAHGGEEDQHSDIEEAEDPMNQGNENNPETLQPQDQQEPQQDIQQQGTQQQGAQQQGAQQQGAQQQGIQQQELSISDIAKRNKEYNKILREAYKNLKKHYDYDEGEKSEILRIQNRSRITAYGGGGARMDDAKDADIATFRAIQEFLLRLASEPSAFGKMEGKEKWDVNKIVKTRFNANFDNARFLRPRERNIWFIVDNSGSVSVFAEFIISMIQGAANIVNVAMGSEAKPTQLLKLPRVSRPKVLHLSDLDRFTIWEQEFKYSFIECLERFIKECNVYNGDVLVFWGDLMDALETSIDTPEAFRKLLRNYKCYWLLSHDGTERYSGNHTKIIEVSRAFKMLYEINNGMALRKAIQRIK